MRKTKSVSITLPDELVKEIHSYVQRGEFSKFVSELVTNALEERKAALIKEIELANVDEDLNAEFKLWDQVMGDGIDD